MTESGRIDDPVDASFEAWPDEPEDLGKTFRDLALSFSGLFFDPAAVLKILKDRFLPNSRSARVVYLLEGIRIKLDHLESDTKARFEGVASQVEELRKTMQSFQSKLEKPMFEEAVAVACEEAVRATNLQKINQFASILVGSLTPSAWSEPDEDVATMIRDIGQLGENDIRVLQLLKSAFSRILEGHPNLNVPSAFTENFDLLREALRESGIHTDDFYSSCARLLGFGLALEEVRSGPRMELYDRCFRPTRRGMALLAYLDTMGAGSSTTK